MLIGKCIIKNPCRGANELRWARCGQLPNFIFYTYVTYIYYVKVTRVGLRLFFQVEHRKISFSCFATINDQWWRQGWARPTNIRSVYRLWFIVLCILHDIR